jgi:hypothetical protein
MTAVVYLGPPNPARFVNTLARRASEERNISNCKLQIANLKLKKTFFAFFFPLICLSLLDALGGELHDPHVAQTGCPLLGNVGRSMPAGRADN